MMEAAHERSEDTLLDWPSRVTESGTGLESSACEAATWCSSTVATGLILCCAVLGWC